MELKWVLYHPLSSGLLKNSIIIGIGVFAAIIIGVVVYSGNHTIEKPTEINSVDNITSQNITSSEEFQQLTKLLESKKKFDFETHDYVRFYKGTDGKGATIVDVLNSRMYANYPDLEQITLNPHRIEWYNYIDEEKGKNFVIVGYAFETFKEKSEYIWEVDKTTKIITAKNAAAQEILDIVNSQS